MQALRGDEGGGGARDLGAAGAQRSAATAAAHAAARANRDNQGAGGMSMLGLAPARPPRAAHDPEIAEGRKYVRAQLANEHVFMR